MPARAPDETAPAPLNVWCALRRALLCCCAAIAVAPASALAQLDSFAFKPAVQFEMRADLLAGPPATVQAGVGANVAAGFYMRIGADATVGASSRAGGAVASGRVDLVARYLLDPFRQFRWGPYVGGGFTAQWEHRAN